MGLLDHLLGNATEVNTEALQRELETLFVADERVEKAFRVFRDLMVFTNQRLLLVDVQGVTGSKKAYHSIPYRAITQFSVSTAGSFDLDSELRIWVAGGGVPLTKQLRKGADVVGIQRHLATRVMGRL